MLLLSTVFSAGISLICQPYPLKCHPSTVCLFPCGCSICCTRPYPPFFLPSWVFLFTFQNKSAASSYQENTPLQFSCGNVVCWLKPNLHANVLFTYKRWFLTLFGSCLRCRAIHLGFLSYRYYTENLWVTFPDWHKTFLLAGPRGLCCFSISAVLRPGPHMDAHF